jgi:hypothetical protein
MAKKRARIIKIEEAGDCPYQWIADSCTHPDACEERVSEQCVISVQPPPPWCPIRDQDVILRVGSASLRA